jgi:hypothetical protein
MRQVGLLPLSAPSGFLKGSAGLRFREIFPTPRSPQLQFPITHGPFEIVFQSDQSNCSTQYEDGRGLSSYYLAPLLNIIPSPSVGSLVRPSPCTSYPRVVETAVRQDSTRGSTVCPASATPNCNALSHHHVRE